MPPTVRTLIETPELELTCLAGETALDAPIRWVHVSEVEDPTPWLKGGEFLMTTALAVRDDAAVELFFRRLSDTGLAGVGFGTGMTFDEVPGIWRQMADAHRIPLVEIPITTPYVAISELVSHRLAEEQREAVQRALNIQRELTKAAARPGGPQNVVGRLATAVDGWVTVCDMNGTPVISRPPDAATRLSEFEEDLKRCRNAAGGAAVSVTNPSESVLIQQLGAPDRVRSLLVVGGPGEFSPYDRMIVSSAATLLSMDVERRHAVSAAERWFRDRLTVRLIDGAESPDERLTGLRALGFSPSHLRVARIDTPEPRDQNLATHVEDHFRTRSIPCLAGHVPHRRDEVWAIVEDHDLKVADHLLRMVAGAPSGVRAGLGRVVAPDDVGSSARQAELALQAAARLNQPMADFDDLELPDLLPGLISQTALRSLIEAYLSPLDRADPGETAELRRSLHAFLAANGTWEHAATQLGVHRHTLRHRIGRIEHLLGLSLSSADTRSMLWLALTADRALCRTSPTSRRGGGTPSMPPPNSG